MTKEQEALIKQLAQMGDVVVFKNKAEAFVHYMTNLDLVGIEHLLYDKYTYQHWTKRDFLFLLSLICNSCRVRGINKINTVSTICNGCNKDCVSYNFYHEQMPHYFVLFVEIEEEEIVDIYQCYNSKNIPFLKDKSQTILPAKVTPDFDIFYEDDCPF